MNFNWNMRLGNPQNLQPSVPQRIDQRGQDALDRKRLRRASNTIVILGPEVPRWTSSNTIRFRKFFNLWRA